MVKKSQPNHLKDIFNEPLAIIGMNCQFPGVDSDIEDVDTLYEMLQNGQTSIKEVPKNRWDIDEYYNADRKKADKIITRKGGFLKNIQLFDPSFFNLSSVETKQIDPQHRLFLEVSIRALNHANMRLDSLNGSNTGVYCGISSQDYSQLNFKDNVQFNAYTQIGAASSAAVGRLCHFLNLKGPSMVVDTACSSSMSALYLAATALRAQQCHMAIVGGVHLNLCPENFIGLSKANMLSATGKCSTFDSKADGFSRSEGCGVVVVKRLRDALKNNDTIHAVIKSIVMNQDGDGASLVAPNLSAQIAMHQAALEQANLRARDIDYIETHGTGTVVGDTVEFNAIQHVHQGHHSKDKPLIIGALKSNLGHTIASSGIASLIKVICALKNESIPPNINYSSPNKSIDPESIPALLPVKSVSFVKYKHKKRIVHVSNFGFSGTNVGAIVEESPNFKLKRSITDNNKPQCFVISANSEGSLKQMIVNYATFLQKTTSSLDDICYTLVNCRDHYKFRCAILVNNKESLINIIKSESYQLHKVVLQKDIKKTSDDVTKIYEAYLSGANIKIDVNDNQVNKIDLPLYFFDRNAYWHEPRKTPSRVHWLDALSQQPKEQQLETIKTKLAAQINIILNKKTPGHVDDLVLSRQELEDWLLDDKTCGEEFVKVALPNNTLDGQKCWPDKKREPIRDNDISHPLLGQMLSMPANEYLFNQPLDLEQLIYIKQQRVFEKIIFPASAYIESGLSAAKSIFKRDGFYFEKFKIERLLFPTQDQAFQLQVKPIDDKRYKINIFAQEDKNWHLFSEMHIHAIPPSPPLAVTIDDLKSCFTEDIKRSHIYANFKSRSLSYDDECQVIQEAYVNRDSVLSKLSLTNTSDGLNYYYHPLLLEGAMQSIFLLNSDTTTYLPYAFTRMTVFQGATSSMWVHVTKRDMEDINEYCVDIKFYDSIGLLLGHIEELTLRQVTRDHFISYDRTLQHLYHTKWVALNVGCQVKAQQTLVFPEFLVISNDPIKAKKRLGNLHYQLIKNLNNVDNIETKNILFFYEQGQFMELFHCCQILFKSYPARFILVTEYAYAINPNDEVNPYHTMASSFWKSFKNELDFNYNYVVDLDLNRSLITALTSLFNSTNTENQFAVRDAIYVPRLEKKQLPTYFEKQKTLYDSNASYLIIGGTGGLATPLIEYLIQRQVKHIILISRSECNVDTKALIDKASHKQVSITHYAADASNYKQMEHIIETINKSDYTLKGVFHLAGLIQDGLIVNLTDEHIQQVLNAKMESALILHQLTQHMPLDLFVMFSSTASLLGGRGQSNYAAANGFLDGLAHLRQQQGKRTLAINWGPFHTVGMAAHLTKALQQQGYTSLDKGSIDIIDALLESQLAQISPCPIDWDLYFKHSLKQAWLSDLIKTPPPTDQRFLNYLKQHTKAECVTILTQVLGDITATVLALNNMEKITAYDPLFTMGLDSLMSLEIRHQIHDKLQCNDLSLSIEYFINDSCIDKIARHITEELQPFFDNTTPNQPEEHLTVNEVAVGNFQYLFWILNRVGYRSNIGLQLRLHGALNKDYVLQAFDFVVKQNSAFWINFDKRTPTQTLNKQGQFNLIYKNISLSNETDSLHETFHTNIMRIIPLTKQPLIRVYLYKINNDLHELHLLIPHIIVDAPSATIVFNQFKTSYEALTLGKKLIQTPEKNTFLNYVQQNNQHHEKDINNKIDFWKVYNRGFKLLDFGHAHHLPDAALYQPKHLFHYSIPTELIEPFFDWHKAKNMNVSTGLIAACQIAFHQISHQTKIPIRLIHSGREGSQYKSTVGLFAEYKRINISLHKEDTFIDCVKSIEAQFLKTAPYQKCFLSIKDKGLRRTPLSIAHYAAFTLCKLFLTKQFKRSKINTTLIDFYLKLLSNIEVNKKIFFIKYKLNRLFNLNIPMQQRNRLDVLISITPSFFIKETQDRRFSTIDYSFASHFSSLEHPIGNQTLWIYFTKNQYGDHLLSINGPLTTACKDQIASNFNKTIATVLERETLERPDLVRVE